MKYYVLCSGSKGNCSVICTKETKVIVDCGATKSYLQSAFEEIGIDYTECDALLLTHEHVDHIRQIKMFDMLDVYAPFEVGGIRNEKPIVPMCPFQIKDLTILPLLLSHDTEICVGYIFFDGKETLVQVTDTGILSSDNRKMIQGADYYIFESNHDPDMLMQTNRPYQIKRRILSDHGHMNNEYSSDQLCHCINENTKEIILAHISQEANDYALAYGTLANKLKQRGIGRDGLMIKAIRQFEIYKGGNQD